MTTTTLQDLTGHESGAILYDDGYIWVGNWSGINGLPYELPSVGPIGMGEDLSGAVRIARGDIPSEIIDAMDDHTAGYGDDVVPGAYDRAALCAWELNGAIIVINTNWH